MADMDEVKGGMKEAAGKVTGDKDLESEGKVQGKVGDAKDAAGDMADKAKDKLHDVRDGV